MHLLLTLISALYLMYNVLVKVSVGLVCNQHRILWLSSSVYFMIIWFDEFCSVSFRLIYAVCSKPSKVSAFV